IMKSVHPLSEVTNMPDLKIDVRTQGKVTIVEPIGYINAHTAKEFETVLQGLVDMNRNNIVINCRALAYIASAGLGAIMGCIDAVRENLGDIRICSMNETVLNIFDVLGFTRLYSIFEDESVAVRSFETSDEP
ncbi:MAG TPA: STAS domain-containing protein, partial [Acidobacteriota bacterium]|nr:STAS domain-containing protein [Acidobacteriota bacterium]